MSPSSAGGPLEVERYIGSYLISSTARSKNAPKGKHVNTYQTHHPNLYRTQKNMVLNEYPQQRYNQPMHGHEGWAGGMPLISIVQRRSPVGPKNNFPPGNYQHNQLSRLAIHTQGAPLILSGRYHGKKNPGNQQRNPGVQRKNQPNVQRGGSNCDTSSKDNSNPASSLDTISVASDESSGSNNSENCLPRIIKPRKRRKKDRKPNVHGQTNATTNSNASQESSSDNNNGSNNNSGNNNACSNKVEKVIHNLVTLQPYIPYSYQYHPKIHGGNVINASDRKLPDDIPDIPNLTHVFDDVKGCDDFVQNQCSPISSCQCKLCDPSGQIWDVDSPFLATTENIFFNSTRYDTSSDDSAYCSQNENSASTLRRSWSDPVSAFSRSEEDNGIGSRVGVIGAGRREREWHGNPTSAVQCATSPSSSKLSVSSTESNTAPNSPQVLDISTEIVTSLNGHRDIEIKFFSTNYDQKNVDTNPNVYGVSSVIKVKGDAKNVEWSDNSELDCDISYDTADISKLLFDPEE